MPHFPGHIRDAFTNWVESRMPEVATIEIRYQPHEVPARRLLGMVWHCTDILPSDLCSLLGIEAGSTYARAAQSLHRSLT